MLIELIYSDSRYNIHRLTWPVAGFFAGMPGYTIFSADYTFGKQENSSQNFRWIHEEKKGKIKKETRNTRFWIRQVT